MACTRRHFSIQLLASIAVPTLFDLRTPAVAQTAPELPFDQALDQLISDSDALRSARSFRELEYIEAGPSAEQRLRRPALPRRWVSDLKISDRAVDLIVACEVTSKQVYERTLQRATWPKGQSGVTIGIGYDLGYVSTTDFASDWKGFLDDAQVATLGPACGLRGPKAGDVIEQFKTVSVTWELARAQFQEMLKYYAGQVVAYFPNADRLTPDSFGALVSLVYNRGSASSSSPDDQQDRRKEVREIKQLMIESKFQDIPQKFRDMKRLWMNDPDARGLLLRRDAEAALFALGLQKSK